MSEAKKLYKTIETILIANGLLTKEQSNMIVRPGTRKGYLWKRHIIDVCSFVLNKIEREGLHIESAITEMLEKSIEWCKKPT